MVQNLLTVKEKYLTNPAVSCMICMCQAKPLDRRFWNGYIGNDAVV